MPGLSEPISLGMPQNITSFVLNDSENNSYSVNDSELKNVSLLCFKRIMESKYSASLSLCSIGTIIPMYNNSAVNNCNIIPE